MVRTVVPLVALCLAVACRAQSGVLVVESVPAQATVVVDSVRVGRSPVTWPVAAGAHRVEVLYTGYAPFERVVMVAAGDTLVVRATLERRTGAVSVRGLPAGAAVTIDGAPDVGGAVPTGEATLGVAVPGERPLRAVVRVESGAETVVEYRRRTLDASTLALAVLVPGSPQLGGGRPLVGGVVVAGLVAGVGAAVVAGGAARRAERATDAAYLAYLGETTEAGAVAAWAGVAREVSREQRARRVLGASLAAAAVVYAVSLADAVVHHVRPPGLRVRAPRAVVTAGPGVGAGLAFSL